jgi:hypothetical protein
LIPGSGIRNGKIQIQNPGSRMNIPDHIFENLVQIRLKILTGKFFDADSDPRSFQPWIWDPEWKNRILDPG